MMTLIKVLMTSLFQNSHSHTVCKLQGGCMEGLIIPSLEHKYCNAVIILLLQALWQEANTMSFRVMPSHVLRFTYTLVRSITTHPLNVL